MADTIIKRLQVALEGGYTSGAGSVYNGGAAVVANKRLAVANDVMFDWEDTWERQIEGRGTYAGVYQSSYMQQQYKGKFNALVYPDDLVYLFRGIVSGAPTVTTLPTTPQSLLAATAIAATMTLTSQPNAQADTAKAKKLAFTLANASTSATAVTVTITGVAADGSTSEQISFAAGTQTLSAVGGGAAALSVTLYSQKYWKTVTNFTTSAQPTGDTFAVGGINAFLWVFPADMLTSTLQSLTGEYLDGSAAWQLTGMVLTKLAHTIQFGKSSKIAVDIEGRQKLALAGSTGSINPTAQAGDPQALQNITDSIAPAINTVLGRIYADPIGTAAGTTLLSNRVTDCKIDIDMAVKLGKAGDLTPYPSYVGREAYGDKVSNEFTLLFNTYKGTTYDPAEVNAFLTQASRVVRFAFAGGTPPCGVLNTAGNWPAALQDGATNGGYYGVMYDLAGKYKAMNEATVDGRLAMKFQIAPEVDLTALNGLLSVTCVATIDPNH